MITGIKLVTLLVEDQDEAVEFYVDKLGFTLQRNDDYAGGGRWIEISPPGSVTNISLKTPEMFDEGEREHRRALIGDGPQLAYHVDDCWDTYESLRELGVPFDSEPTTESWGTQAVARDPSGTQVVLVETAT